MKNSNISKFANVLAQVNLEDIYLRQVFEYYMTCYTASGWAQAYVQNSSRIPEELRASKSIGLVDRTLGGRLGGQRTLEGGAIRGSMKQAGLFLTTGGELFRHCVVFPQFEDSGLVVSAVGYRYGQRIRPTQSAVIHWTKPDPDEYCCRGLKLVEDLTHAKTNH
ncbi:MAG: hypothetical protein ACJAS1_005581 [Oleiphilaceae bacterium]|jgi:hypothetical protein